MDLSTAVLQAKANLSALGLPISDDELERAAQQGFFDTARAFHELVVTVETPEDIVPDFLTERLPAPPEVPLQTKAAAAKPQDSPTIATLACALRRGETSSLEVVTQILHQIEAQDRTLNAFQLVLADQALAQACEADAELARGTDRGPLHGLPVALKDLIDLVGTPTTAGSRVRAQHIATHDAALVEQLRQAGAITIGKTRLPEFAYSGASNNPHYGPVRNPRSPEHDSGGSSSGSAAAVAAGLVVMAIGTDTGGSIRIPTSYCGVVGLKPTFGRVSLTGVFPLAWSLDHAGPITRTVADAAISLAAISQPDSRDPRTYFASWREPVAPLIRQHFSGNVGVLELDGITVNTEVAAVCERSLALLEQAGAMLIPLALPELVPLRIVSAALSNGSGTRPQCPYPRVLAATWRVPSPAPPRLLRRLAVVLPCCSTTPRSLAHQCPEPISRATDRASRTAHCSDRRSAAWTVDPSGKLAHVTVQRVRLASY